MEVIFGTTNQRKIEDLNNIAREMGMNLKISSMNDIGWNLGEIEETGSTIEENSSIKAEAIYDFCTKKGIALPIIADDAGLFVDALNGKPGIYTARYGDDEIIERKRERIANPNLPELPPYQCVEKLLSKLEGVDNRSATYRCAVTCIMTDGRRFQKFGESKGRIAKERTGEPKKPYFYSVFILDGQNKPFAEQTPGELEKLKPYRYAALEATLSELRQIERLKSIEIER